MHYIIQIYSPRQVDTVITDSMEKEKITRTHGKNVRFLSGPHHTEREAKKFIPEALANRDRWDKTSPMFYEPGIDIVWVRNAEDWNEKQAVNANRYEIADFAGI